MEQLTRVLFSYKPKDEVTLTIYRDAKKIEVDVILGTAKDED